jgi:3-methyl-2-oxobutanoate hydroxymethyltransferase
MNVLGFGKMKAEDRKISMVTCYDYSSARAVAKSTIDCILVGDSVAMMMHGHATTLSATTEMMAQHTAAVARGAQSKFIVADLPFLSYRKGLKDAMDAVQMLMGAGAHAVKLEGVNGHERIIRHIVQSGVPVMGHLGLTPQSMHQLGGMKVQARTDTAVELLVQQALRLEKAGCFAIVVECVPSEAARKVTALLTIPTIGIGAGPHVSGQVLVYHDVLGLNPDFKPKFVRTYVRGIEIVSAALDAFDRDVKGDRFPTARESYFESPLGRLGAAKEYMAPNAEHGQQLLVGAQ